MTPSTASQLAELEVCIRRLVDRTAGSRHIHSLLLAVRTDDDQIDIRTAAGAAAPSDPYYIASITKMFTASIIMQLIDEEQLSLDDRLGGLLPHLDLTGIHRHRGVDRTPDIRLHHLLHQTSGLPDYFAGQLEDDLKHNRDRGYTIDDIVDIARATPARFAPGDRGGKRSAYSDTNYQLLTAIIETVTDTAYADAVEHRITRPLDLEDTYVAGHGQTQPTNEPLQLHYKDRALELPHALASEQGAGGAVSTLDDQLRFMMAYHNGKLFDRVHTADLRQWNRIFFPVDYGYGLMRYRLPRWLTAFRQSPELIGHSGSTNSFAFYAPDLRCHIVGTLNQMDNPSRAFRLISKISALVGKQRRQVR